MTRVPPHARRTVSRAERAFLSAAADPRPGALSAWEARYGARPARTAKRGRDSNWARGMAAERLAMRVLRREGYTVTRAQSSAGAADILARRARPDVAGPPVRDVQVKRLEAFRPDGLNDAVARFLGLGRWTRVHQLADGTRESWLYIDGEGWVARAVLDATGTLQVSGPRAVEVERSLNAMLARGGPQTTRETRNAHEKPTLIERLGVE